MTWLITMGSGAIKSGWSLDGISANFIRLHSNIWKWKKKEKINLKNDLKIIEKF